MCKCFIHPVKVKTGRSFISTTTHMNILIQQLCSNRFYVIFSQNRRTYVHTHISGAVSDKVSNSLLSGGSGLYSRAWYTTLDLATLHTSDTTLAPTLISTRHFTALLSLSKLSCCPSRGVTIATLMRFMKKSNKITDISWVFYWKNRRAQPSIVLLI